MKFLFQTKRQLNSTAVKTAFYGWLEQDQDDDGATYVKGITIEFPKGTRVFYPASEAEFDELTSQTSSAGRYYNVFLRGRAGAADVTDLLAAPSALMSADASLQPAEPVEGNTEDECVPAMGTANSTLPKGFAEIVLHVEFDELAEYLQEFPDEIASVRFDG